MARVPKINTDDRSVELYRVDQIYRSVRAFIYSAAAVAIMYLVGVALAPFAGQQTIVSVALSFLADIKFAIAISLTGAATAWALVERRLRERKTKYLQDRIKELETGIDPDRSTSGLTRTGRTNPRDKRR